MKEKIRELARELLSKVESIGITDEDFNKMSQTEKLKYISHQSYCNGQLNVINQVLSIIGEK